MRSATREVRMQLLRPGELVAEKKRYPLGVCAGGTFGVHGPHLPIGTDALGAQEITRRSAIATGGVVMPTLVIGTERENPPEICESLGFKKDIWIVGMDFPSNSMKSFYYREEVFGIVIHELLSLLVMQGYKLIVVVNGHGAQNHIETLKRICSQINATSPARVMYSFPLIEMSRTPIVAHATRFETSEILALYPETVRLEELPPRSTPLKNIDWAIVDEETFAQNPTPNFTVRPEHDPREASAAEGEKHLKEMVDCLATRARQAMAGLGY